MSLIYPLAFSYPVLCADLECKPCLQKSGVPPKTIPFLACFGLIPSCLHAKHNHQQLPCAVLTLGFFTSLLLTALLLSPQLCTKGKW